MQNALEKIAIIVPLGYSHASLEACLNRFADDAVALTVVISHGSGERPVFADDDDDRFQSLNIIWHVDDAKTLFSSIHNGLKQVQTPYAMVLDTDDIVLPTGLAGLAAHLDEAPSHLATAGLHVIYNDPQNDQPQSSTSIPWHGAPGLHEPDDLWAHEQRDDSALPLATGFSIALSPLNNESPSAVERAHTLGETFFPALYALYRTEVLDTLVLNRMQNGIDDPLLSEMFIAWDLAQKSPYTLHGGFATHLSTGRRVNHLRTHHAYYNRFFDPDLMDSFHRAVEGQAELDVREEASHPDDKPSPFAWLKRLFKTNPPSTDASFDELRQRQEELIRLIFGRFVHNLTINSVLSANGGGEKHLSDLEQLLIDYGMTAPLAAATLAEVSGARDALSDNA